VRNLDRLGGIGPDRECDDAGYEQSDRRTHLRIPESSPAAILTRDRVRRAT
jgi:hypothetical protein